MAPRATAQRAIIIVAGPAGASTGVSSRIHSFRSFGTYERRTNTRHVIHTGIDTDARDVSEIRARVDVPTRGHDPSCVRGPDADAGEIFGVGRGACFFPPCLGTFAYVCTLERLVRNGEMTHVCGRGCPATDRTRGTKE